MMIYYLPMSIDAIKLLLDYIVYWIIKHYKYEKQYCLYHRPPIGLYAGDV